MQPDWNPPDEWSYALLLGLYLGDGCLSNCGRTYQLRVALDDHYPRIIDDCVMGIQLTMLPRRVYVRPQRSRSVVVEAASQHWPAVFPQHGPGRKHERPIRLTSWQQAIVDHNPEAFLRGLIWSDGCRTVNRFQTKLPSGRVATYAYPRYFFSNLSADIRELFCASCDRLAIRWTQSNQRNISVSHRHSVAKLDEFVGPKR